jgi:hypothetical protein
MVAMLVSLEEFQVILVNHPRTGFIYGTLLGGCLHFSKYGNETEFHFHFQNN